MALPANIQQFKSSGVYRLEFDKSQLINIPAETIRLVIGYSNKGPFNTPIFVPDVQFFKDVFGDIDTGLELKGSYFHRSCLTALDRGPILALNLLDLPDSVTAEFRALSAQSNLGNHAEGTSAVKEFFNRDKFWFIDDEAVINAVDANDSTVNATSSPNGSTIFNLANSGRKNISVFVTKSSTPGFDITAEEWYGSGKVPPFLDKSSLISDFLVRVVVLEGDFSNYAALSVDPIYGDYFTTKGLKATITDSFGNSANGIDKLLQLPEVTALAEYTGSLIPEFQDKDGTNLFIEDIVNNETSYTGLVLAMNKDWFYDNPSVITDAIVDGLQLDLIGHGLEENENGISVIDFLSYFGTLNELQAYRKLDYNHGASGASASTYLFTGADPGATSRMFDLDASAAYNTASGGGAYDQIKVFGPYHPWVVGGTAQSLFATTTAGQDSFEDFANSIIAGESFVSAGLTGASATAYAGPQYTLARVSDRSLSTVGSYKDLLTVQITSTDEAGNVPGYNSGTTSGAGLAFTLGWNAGNTSNSASTGATATIEIVPNINYTINPVGSSPIHSSMFAGPKAQLGLDVISGVITTGDKIQGSGPTASLNPIKAEVINSYDLETLADVKISVPSGSRDTDAAILSHKVANGKVTAFTDDTFVTEVGILPGDSGFATQFIAIPQNGATGATYNESVYISTLEGNINEVYPIGATNIIGVNKIKLGSVGTTAGQNYIGEIQVGQFMVRGFESVTGSGDYDTKIDPRTGTTRLTRVKSATYDSDVTSPTYGWFIVETYDAIFTYPDLSGVPTAVERYTSIDDFVTHYTVTALDGYTVPTTSKPNNTNSRMNQILDVMYNTNIAETLQDRDSITFRYIVDTFNHGIEASSKARLSKIAKGRKNAFAILNSPSVKEFKNSTNPLFKFDSQSTFDARYVATGGNLALNPSNIYSLPSIADGANYCGFYTPNLRISENGTTKFVPPAAHISNLYIDKYNLALPWSIVAGPRRGVVAGTGVSGVEYSFDRKDLDNIEPFGLNAIVNKQGFGLVINANQTAQQTVKSALSQIHVRELLIYIEDGIAEILKNYRWEFNTQQNRLEIKTLADNFLSQILNDGGLYDFQNVMDSSNNTNEVIDNNIGILDTYVEPVRGMGILVNRVTILKTGSIQAGNF